MAAPGSSHKIADAALAAIVVLIVGMMIVPLPTTLLDLLIASNVSLAVLMLLVSMYIQSGLQFTAFPTILLVTTLFRLALNVSSTRLILLDADAGDVIAAFGNFVVQGNYVVGAVIFLILTLIQFLVIAKGSERVAEVGARFTLDAMPGKQMSIDAELRSGALTQEQAREKRSTLQRESQFYGAMDGAMKFVKGDAIAGIVITIVNILGGLAIGIGMRGMSADDALKTFGLLTIGDGLVSQIPALLISTAAGLVVTRVASEDENSSLGGDVAQQIFGNPKALGIAAIFLLLLASVPGLPFLPFIVLAIVFGTLAWRLSRAPAPVVAPEQVVAKQEAARETKARRQMVPLVVPVTVDLSPALAEQITDGSGGGSFLEESVPELRDALFLDLGIALPGVRVRTSPHLEGARYLISTQEVPVVDGEVAGELMALETVGVLAGYGVQAKPAVDPATGSSAGWVDESAREALEAAQIPLLTQGSVVSAALERAVRRRARELVGMQEVQAMLDQLERAYPALVKNVVPKPVSLALLTDVLRRLVEESISVRPMREILEALATYAPNERDPITLTELVRSELKRMITHSFAHEGAIAAFTLSPDIEEVVRDGVQRTATGTYLAIAPDLVRDIVSSVKQAAEDLDGDALIVVTAPDVRRYVRMLLHVQLPEAVVLSFGELDPEAQVVSLGQIGMGGLE